MVTLLLFLILLAIAPELVCLLIEIAIGLFIIAVVIGAFLCIVGALL